MKKTIIIAILVLTVSSCASRVVYDGITVKNWKVEKKEHSFNAKFDEFSGRTYQNIKMNSNNDESFLVQSNLDKGSIIVYLVDQNKKPVWTSKELKKNREEVGIVNIKANKNYQLFVEGNNASGKFKITWN